MAVKACQARSVTVHKKPGPQMERGYVLIMVAGGILLLSALALAAYEFYYLSLSEFCAQAGW